MDTTRCPQCGQIAEVQWRTALESTEGPVEHAKVLCVRRHWFLLPVSALPGADLPPAATRPGTESTPTRPHP